MKTEETQLGLQAITISLIVDTKDIHEELSLGIPGTRTAMKTL
jgi:hypothetical protein